MDDKNLVAQEGQTIIDFDGKRYYVQRHRYFMARDGAYLHRAVWQKANGEIPQGHHIHHINRVKTDNRLENLQCLTPSAHHSLHGHDPRKKNQNTYGERSCANCGTSFVKKSHAAIYCSLPCKEHAGNHRRHMALSCVRAENRSVPVPCIQCGKAFSRPMKKNHSVCSQQCARERHNTARNHRRQIARAAL